MTGEREREGGCDGNDDGIQAVFASAVRVILKPHPRYSTSWILGHWRTGERDVAVMVAPGYKTGERRERDVVVKMYLLRLLQKYTI